MGNTDLRFDFAALPERVWEAFANPAKAALWLPGGALIEIGRRITLPGGSVFEVTAVDRPNHVEFRCRPAGSTSEVGMRWVVSAVPGGASVHVIISPARDVRADGQLLVDLRTLFDEYLRGLLRGRPVPPPVRAPEVAQPSSMPEPPLASMSSMSSMSSAAPASDGESQAVRVWPAVRVIKRLGATARGRTSGTSLAIRLVAVIALAAALAVITLGAPSIPWAAPPGESTLDDEAVLGSRGPSGPATPVAPTARSTGTALPAGTNPGSTSTTANGGAPVTGGPSVPVPVVPLQVSLTVSDRLLSPLLVGYTVRVSITNSAEVGQTWQNVAVQVGDNVVVVALDSLVALDLVGADACASPTGTTTIGTGETVQFRFKVTGASLSEPTGALLNQPGCA